MLWFGGGQGTAGSTRSWRQEGAADVSWGSPSPHLLTCFTGLNQAAFIRRPACLKSLPTFTLFLSELRARVKEHVRRRAEISLRLCRFLLSHHFRPLLSPLLAGSFSSLDCGRSLIVSALVACGRNLSFDFFFFFSSDEFCTFWAAVYKRLFLRTTQRLHLEAGGRFCLQNKTGGCAD